MTIRIQRNAAGNCLNFVGSSLPAYFNACLSGAVDPDVPSTVNVINDVFTANDPNGQIRYEFYQMPYTEFADKDGNAFADAQAAADYITAQGNVLGVSDAGTDLTGVVVNFRLDETSTSIIMDNGAAFGVNTIKAVPDADGTIHIHAIGAGVPEDSNEPDDHKHYEKLSHTSVQINGVAVSGGINDVCNALNELFTVGPFQSVVITDPEATVIADVAGVADNGTNVGSNVIDPVGDDVLGTTATHNNAAGYKSANTIDQAGEYFTFDIAGKATYGFGLIVSDADYAAGNYQGSASYADPANFCVGANSSHLGYQFAHHFHIGNAHASWTNYGASTGYVMGPAWYDHNNQFDLKDEWNNGDPVKVKVGIDVNGFIEIATLADDGVNWKLHARSSYPVAEGVSLHLGIKLQTTGARLRTMPKVHLREPAAPVLNFRYIESPDNTYQWPLFATEEEANYYDQNHTIGSAGSGTSHQHVFPDDPSSTTWYMPDTGSTMGDTQDPVGVQFAGQSVNWTEITSLTNADLAPPAFANASVSVDEGSAFNYQTQPQDVGYTTTITGSPSNPFISFAGMLTGTAPEVAGDNVANPSDDYVLTVTRTNSYGSSTGTLTVTVNNLTAPVVTPIAGVTHIGGTDMTDADTMGDGSVIAIDNVVNDGNRLVINKEWLDNFVLPAITSGTGTKAVLVGFASDNADWSSVTTGDFRSCYMFYCTDDSRASNNWRLRSSLGGALNADVGIGSLTSGLYDYVFINDGGTLQQGALVESQGHDASTTVFEDAQLPWHWTLNQSGHGTQSRELVIATSGCELDLDLSYFNEYSEPAPAPTILTPWTKALDFSGSAERALQVSTSSNYNPLMMGGLATTTDVPSPGNTASSGYSRPWATACVFKSDGHNSNQHIWNAGEGVNGDNIYLRLAATGNLYFGWGRDGTGVNECLIGNGFHNGNGINQFYGVYIGHNGTRLSGGNATASNLAECFDIYIMRLNDAGTQWSTVVGGLTDAGGNRSITSNWQSTGYRMDRATTGQMSIGGRGANRSFHGKVASMVVTTLNTNSAMPAKVEAETMITDPVKWLNDYKIGNGYRYPTTGSQYAGFQINSVNANAATQVWLMGDGSYDSYSNMIRNFVRPSDQNYTKLNLISMVSNDIQTVNIPGLS